jgi:hypothetical protein
MSRKPRVCVYFSVGRNFLNVLRSVKQSLPDASITAVIPPGYPISGDERSLAEEIIETDLVRYSWRTLPALARLVRQFRRERYDAFVILFDSPRLRIVSSLSGAAERLHCRMDGRLALVRMSIPGTIADVVFRNVWGRIVYAVIWSIVRFRPVRLRDRRDG